METIPTPQALGRQTPCRARRARLRTLTALGFTIGLVALRVYWATGGRWGYSACTPRSESTELGDGCGAGQLTTLPLWSGWGAVAVCCALLAVAVWTVLRQVPRAAPVACTAAAVLAVAAFPLHLMFEIPAGVAGRPTDWRDIGYRLFVLSAAVAWAAAAAAIQPRPARPASVAARPAPRWLRRCTVVAVAIPVIGWCVPHALWLFGVPAGISVSELARARQDIGLPAAAAVTFLPAIASLLTLGLGAPWGQVFPQWMPLVGGRGVPRLLAAVPAALVASLLTAYGAVSLWMMGRAVLRGTVGWTELGTEWAVSATVLVFLAWGASLGAATVGYLQLTRSRPR